MGWVILINFDVFCGENKFRICGLLCILGWIISGLLVRKLNVQEGFSTGDHGFFYNLETACYKPLNFFD